MSARVFVASVVRLCGVNVRQARTGPSLLRKIAGDARGYGDDVRFPIHWREAIPVGGGGGGDPHYFHHDLWAAGRILAERPAEHVDVGSRVDGFLSHLLLFMPVTHLDINPPFVRHPNLHFRPADGTTLEGVPDRSVDSLSSLSVIEHFGLGRYGDPVDPAGWELGLRALQRVLAPGGRLYLAVPIGRQRVCFNAHRVFDPATIVAALPELDLVAFSAVSEAGELVADADLGAFSGASYASGLFEFVRP